MRTMPVRNESGARIIVVGGGHAGCEAAASAARIGVETLLVTLRRDRIAEMSCNPAIGGLAKGQIVREVDALGGLMGLAADRCGIQFRLLNASKGPAVRAPRAQEDKALYRREMLRRLEQFGSLAILEAEAEELDLDGLRIRGLQTSQGYYKADAVVITSGTFLNGLIHIGETSYPAGRLGEAASLKISDSLRKAGLRLERLKTGTPPRILKSSIDFAAMAIQPGDDSPTPFSFLTPKLELEQVPCHITQTNERTHEVIRANLGRSALYSGRIAGRGPRYCPSIEDKVVKFPDRKNHQIFVEPEERAGESYYLNGISSSMPEEVQLEMVRTLRGLEAAVFLRPGYAIEYDFVQPTQLRSTLECKEIEGLYCAGQINGTSGYEEAAGQGLVAGANAALKILGREPFILGRADAYVGVMIDDLITHGVDEPYRMFTSRAENRLQLRSDNADRRLTPAGRRSSLVDDARWEAFQGKAERLRRAKGEMKSLMVGGKKDAEKMGIELRGGLGKPTSLWDLLRRPEVGVGCLAQSAPALEALAPEERLSLETEVKYEGFVERQKKDSERLAAHERERVPEDMDYAVVPGLSREATERLAAVRPETLGQASRIPGMTPAALAALQIEILRRQRGR
jgi:tRNA uridine 5-carboxymethylaminomethyl modification enzyme